MRLLAKLKDSIPWVRDGFPIRVIRRKKTQDGIKKFWDRARVISDDGTDKIEFKRTDGDGVIRMEKENSSNWGELEYFDRSYLIDRRKPFFEVFQNTHQDFYIIDLALDDIDESDDIDTELAQNRNLYHQAAEKIAEDAVEIANPQDNKLLLGVGLLGIMIGSAVVNYLVISGMGERLAQDIGSEVATAVSENTGEAAGAAGTVAFIARGKAESLKEKFL